MFKFFKNNKKENNNELSNTYRIDDFEPADSKNENIEEKPEIKEEEKWIWVEGYKGTDKDMCCNNNFQYKLNKDFIYDGNIELCERGFHFCKNLADVFLYYHLDGINRFFKIKALVKEKDFKSKQDKYVAEEIILQQELTYKELEPYIKIYLPFIKNENEYKDSNNHNILCKNFFINEMIELGFSQIYSTISCEELFDYFAANSSRFIPLSYYNIYKYFDSFINKIKSYISENISKDLLIYFIEQYKNKLIRK